VSFFARITLGFMVWEIVLPRLGLNALSNRTRPERTRRAAVRFRALAVSMGGLMIKVGQFLSARLDVLPPEITDELAGLQDEVPAEEFSAIRDLAQSELGGGLESYFEWFEEAPLAAASLGQAHRARLREARAAEAGFADVVVKIQRPDIDRIVAVDLAALRRVADWLARYKPIAKRADVPALLEEFAVTTRDEIDYLSEASHAEQFLAHFAGDARVRVPAVVWDLTTRRVLTLEDVSAIKITDYAAIEATGIAREEVARVLVETYLKQIFDDGFFHADPHPGNLFVQPLDTFNDDARREWRLTFVDFGMVGRVPENLRAGLRETLLAIGLKDGARLVQSFRRLDVLLPGADLALIEIASMQLFERFGGMSMGDLKSIDHSEMMSFGLQFRDLMLDLPFQLPENLLMLGRSIAILSGMCTGLDAEFNLWSTLTPYASKLIGEEGGSTVQTFRAEAAKVLQTAVGLPARIDRVLTLTERGQLSVQTPLLDLRVRGLEHMVRRAGTALVGSAMLIAGAILHDSATTLGSWLMGLSALPLVMVALGGRRRHPGR
jgi:predicted unusual protein kinase regulating ubiquinone biosynthesis (AarF/ABC1/UbiB family)